MTWELGNEICQWLAVLILIVWFRSLDKRLTLHSRRMDRTDDRITLQQGQINAYRTHKDVQ